MNELVGFVNENNVRQKVLSLLSSKGKMEEKRISKTLRVVSPTIAKGRNVLPDRNRSKSRKNDPANITFYSLYFYHIYFFVLLTLFITFDTWSCP
jgi:hypothetical protein